MTKPKVALVGLRFGAEFAPIYHNHPDVDSVVLCDTDEEVLKQVGDQYGITERYTSLDQVLAAPDIDAVHLVTPLPHHGRASADVLRAGKHCASTVPMALDIDEMAEVVKLQQSSGKNYMMMETAVFTREFLHVQSLYEAGRFGTVTFAKGAHYQDMSHWPSYWSGLPPMWYMTHAIAPVLALLNTRATTVRCLGSGRLSEERQGQYGNRFPAETAIFELEGSDVSVEISRTLFQAARPYTESFAVYGENYGFEWPQIEEETPVHFIVEEGSDARRRLMRTERIEAPDRQDLLPPEIARFTKASVFEDGSHMSFVQGGGHGGSHPHLVHEFVRSIVEDRLPTVDAVAAANWTAAGIMAHESAMRGGEPMTIPSFT